MVASLAAACVDMLGRLQSRVYRIKAEEEAKAAAVAPEEEAEAEDDEEGEEEDESSEYTSDDSEYEALGSSRPLAKPVFVPRMNRESLAEKEALEREDEEAAEREKMRLEQRKVGHV
jgi:microfibrillar-associated protein 1